MYLPRKRLEHVHHGLLGGSQRRQRTEQLLVWWTKRTFDFRRERRRWSRCHFHFLEKAEKQSGISRKIACTLVAPAYIFVPRSTAMLQSRLLFCPFDLRESRRCILPQHTAHSTRPGWQKLAKSGCHGGALRNRKTKWGASFSQNSARIFRHPHALAGTMMQR